MDVGSLLTARHRLTEAVKKLGHVDVLVNCAGITHTATLVDTPSERFQVCPCFTPCLIGHYNNIVYVGVA